MWHVRIFCVRTRWQAECVKTPRQRNCWQTNLPPRAFKWIFTDDRHYQRQSGTSVGQLQCLTCTARAGFKPRDFSAWTLRNTLHYNLRVLYVIWRLMQGRTEPDLWASSHHSLVRTCALRSGSRVTRTGSNPALNSIPRLWPPVGLKQDETVHQ